MEPQVYIYSIRYQGWMTANGTYTSEVKKAKAYNLTSALDIIAASRDGSGNPSRIPVLVEHLS